MTRQKRNKKKHKRGAKKRLARVMFICGKRQKQVSCKTPLALSFTLLGLHEQKRILTGSQKYGKMKHC